MNKETSIFDFVKGKTLDEIKSELLKEPLYLTIRENDEFYIISYQIESDFSYLIVRQCRGIIFEKYTNYCVCKGFNKFFNWNETNAAKIDWNNFRVLSKYDGSIIKCWWYDGEWHISTNNTIDAKTAETKIEGITFYDLFLETFQDVYGIGFYEYANSYLETNTVYLFELIGPKNRIVINYDRPNIYLIGIFKRLAYFKYVENNIYAANFDIYKGEPTNYLHVPKTFECKNFNDVLNALIALDNTHEGFVIMDKNFNRIKMKTENYVILHKQWNNGNITTKRVLEIIKSNSIDDYISVFPENLIFVSDVIVNLKAYIKCVLNDLWYFKRFLDLSRKEYAKEVKETYITNSNFLFRLYDKKFNEVSFEEIKSNVLQINNLDEILESKIWIEEYEYKLKKMNGIL
jgi:hypothetical protein